MRTRFLVLIGITATLLAAPAVASAATITVNTTDDVNGGVCTLRDAITAANGNLATGGCVKGSGSDVIAFNLPPNSVITLGSTLPTIQSPIDIQGPGAGQLTVDGANSVRVLDVGGSGTGTISGLTIAHGQCVEGCGVRNSGNETLDHVAVTDNRATVSGGTNAFADAAGIRNQGTLHLAFSTVANNSVTASGATNQNAPDGGGIENVASLTLDHSTLSGNSVTADAGGGSSSNAVGGAISNYATLNVTQSTISGNTVTATGGANSNNSQGGGISSANSPSVHVTLDRTTIAANSASVSGNSAFAKAGGVALAGATFSSTSSTIAGNSAPLYANVSGSPGTFKNTIVADPQGGGANCGTGLTSQGYNLDSGSSCGFTQATDKSGANPMLAPAGLADNGGPTKTIALQPGSPAIDQGVSSAGESADQRGSSRPSDFGAIANASGGDGTDIGAFELQDTTPPDTSIDSGPADGSANNPSNPAFAFSATEPGSTFECSVDGAGYSACSSPDAIGPLGDGQHTFAVRAIDAAHNTDASPATRTFTVDATAPDTSITSGPADGSLTSSANPSFGLGSDDAGASFQCSIDGGQFAACSSPEAIGPLGDGQHTFAVRAVDAANNADPSPATRTFAVDTTAPDTAIDSGPSSGSVTAGSAPAFAFSATEPGSTFECSVDGGGYSQCSSPDAIGPLGDGQHTFAVRAVDGAGNADATPALRTFTVDTTAPETTLVKPIKRTTHRTLKLRFRSSEPGSTFKCKLDGKSYRACSSPLRTRKLAYGRHALRVRAVDGAGNADSTPAKERFRVVRRA